MASVNTTPPIRNDDSRQFPTMNNSVSIDPPTTTLQTLTHRSSFSNIRYYSKRLSSSSNGAATTLDNDAESYSMRSRSGTSISSVSSNSFLKDINNNYSVISNSNSNNPQSQQKITTLKKLFVIKPINNSLKNEIADNDSLTAIDDFQYLCANSHHSKHITKASNSHIEFGSTPAFDSCFRTDYGDLLDSNNNSSIFDSFDETASYNSFISKCRTNLSTNDASNMCSGHINGGNASFGSYYGNNNINNSNSGSNNSNVITVNNSYNIQDSANNNVITINNTYTINKLKSKRSFIFKNIGNSNNNVELVNNSQLSSASPASSVEPKGFRTIMNAKKNQLKKYKSSPALRSQMLSPSLSHHSTTNSSASSISTVTSTGTVSNSGVAYNTTKSVTASAIAGAIVSSSSSPLSHDGFRAYSAGSIPLSLGISGDSNSNKSVLLDSDVRDKKQSRLSVTSDSSTSSSVSMVSQFQTPSLLKN